MAQQKADAAPLVVETTTPGLLMVESRSVQPGAFWPVQAIGPRYQCTCPAGRRRGRCAHTDAAWDTHPIELSQPDEGDVFDRQFFIAGGVA